MQAREWETDTHRIDVSGSERGQNETAVGSITAIRCVPFLKTGLVGGVLRHRFSHGTSYSFIQKIPIRETRQGQKCWESTLKITLKLVQNHFQLSFNYLEIMVLCSLLNFSKNIITTVTETPSRPSNEAFGISSSRKTTTNILIY